MKALLKNAQVPRNYIWCQFFLLKLWILDNNYALFTSLFKKKIPSSDDFANILELLHTF
jgi:hypothetical protein